MVVTNICMVYLHEKSFLLLQILTQIFFLYNDPEKEPEELLIEPSGTESTDLDSIR